jgi:acyl-CoA-binding protein
MSDLKAQFEAAAQSAQSLARRPDNQTLLTLYGLYKQATAGDVSTARPGGFDFVAQAKYDAWARLKGTAPAAAMQQYVDLVTKLRAS